MLHLKDIRKSYVEPDGTILKILDIPDFRVAVGEQVVLMGQSGSGKTTLLHIIAGISRPDSGEVRVAGTDIARLNESSRDLFVPARSAISSKPSICSPASRHWKTCCWE